ncbi:MAG: T9SS type A sorting domain-containing protein [Flavobacteriales bacterium]
MKRSLLSLPASLATALLMAQAANYPAGSTVANFTVTDTHGTVHDLATYAAQGKYVLLDFFFYNCGPCQVHAPYYSELYQTYGCNSADLICIEVNNGSDSDALTEAFSVDFAPGFAHPPAVGAADGDPLTTTFGVSAFPTFCLIGPDSKMKNNDIWPVSSMNTFVAAFPAGSNITPAACLVGISETGRAAFTKVFPSPTTGSVTITFSTTSTHNLSVEVYDMLGQLVETRSFGTLTASAQRTLDLSALADGQYVLKLLANGEVHDATRVTLAR